MHRVTVGILAHCAAPQLLQATLAGLATGTQPPVKLLLLADGPAAAFQQELAPYPDLAVSAGGTAQGAAAGFNRLAAADDAQVVVFLASGAIVGPGWLEMLLAALAADPRNGLAGPSTNRAWNEQGIFAKARGTPAAVRQTAAGCRQRFGRTWQSLEPLHSLADFCYAVKREVIEAVGAADEGYGRGPCWEMDYNVRAARAGFRNVWAKGAYVYRSPLTPGQKRAEALRFEASKHRYQDKFCGLRLRGVRRGYRRHCRGEACEHFAPPARIRIFAPLQEPIPGVKPKVRRPLVSCIMPTRGRLEFVTQSIHYFNRQDYPERELLILDDGAGDLSRKLPDDPRIRYFRIGPGMSIGAKRNHACRQARGSVIAGWDDDDWYAPERLSVQMEPLLAGAAQMTALPVRIYFDLAKWHFWTSSPELHRRLWFEDVAAGTLVFQRRIWQRLAKYPDRSLAEDAVFLKEALRRGAKLVRIDRKALFIYLRHGQNSWSFTCGQHGNSAGWKRIPEPAIPPADRTFYLKMAGRLNH